MLIIAHSNFLPGLNSSVGVPSREHDVDVFRLLRELNVSLPPGDCRFRDGVGIERAWRPGERRWTNNGSVDAPGVAAVVAWVRGAGVAAAAGGAVAAAAAFRARRVHTAGVSPVRIHLDVIDVRRQVGMVSCGRRSLHVITLVQPLRFPHIPAHPVYPRRGSRRPVRWQNKLSRALSYDHKQDSQRDTR